MIHNNIVFISGRVGDIKYHTTKKSDEFATVNVIINSFKPSPKGGYDNYPTFVSVMVFDKRQVDYIKNVSISKGDTVSITAKLSNSKNKSGFMQLTILASNIIVAKNDKDNFEPNADDIMTTDDFIEDF